MLLPANSEERRAQAIARLEQQLLQHTGTAVYNLETRIQQTQHGATTLQQQQEQQQQAQQQQQISSGLRVKNIPQRPKFKGDREGPRVLDWAHQAARYLEEAGLKNEVPFSGWRN